ncbi:MAG: hypothetical protein AB7Q81_03710 [Gammaproteobacteria bacterium]
MRFSANGYYVERYVKCDCCGVLVYDAGITVEDATGERRLYCSPWCREWQAQKLAGVESPQVELPFGV